MKIHFDACEACGAVVAVTVDGEPVIDNREPHEAWHAKLREAVGNASTAFGLSLGTLGATEGI